MPSRSQPRYQLPSLTPRQQLSAGRLGRRLPQLYLGLFLYGWSMAMMIQANLGLDPWDVLHQGLTHFLPYSFGTVTILVGVVVLLLWIPLRQWPGLGTVSNVFVIGVVADFGLWAIPGQLPLPLRIAVLVLGVVLNGLAGAMYLGSHFGSGPRDGLMTGLARRTTASLRLLRTCIEVSVLVVGFLLGGTVGVGTVLYALAIGPLVQFFLPRVAITAPVGTDADTRSASAQELTRSGEARPITGSSA